MSKIKLYGLSILFSLFVIIAFPFQLLVNILRAFPQTIKEFIEAEIHMWKHETGETNE